MKVILKIALFILGIGGVLYWLGTVILRPFTGLWARIKAKKETRADASAQKDETV